MEITKEIPSDKLRSTLITKTAIKTLRSESLVEKVINFAFKDALRELSEGTEVEISGFGKFFVSNSKSRKRTMHLLKRKKKLEYEIANKIVPENYQWNEKIESNKKRDLDSVISQIERIKTKVNIYELIPDFRRLEEQPFSEEGNEGNNRGSFPTKDGSLQKV